MIDEQKIDEPFEMRSQFTNNLSEMQSDFQEKTKSIIEKLTPEQLNIIYAAMDALLDRLAEKYGIPDKAVDFLRFLNKVAKGRFDTDIVTNDNEIKSIVGKSARTLIRGRKDLIQYLEKTSSFAIADIVQSKNNRLTTYRVHLFRILADVTIEYFRRGEAGVKALNTIAALKLKGTLNETELYNIETLELYLDKKINKELPKTSEIIFNAVRIGQEKFIATKWRSSELLAKEYFESLENVSEVEDVSESNLGYDLEVTFKNNRRIYVEVKKVSSFNDSFKLTNNEFANATKYAQDYYVALVIHDPFQISLISNPVAELEYKKVIEQISWKFGDYSDKLQKDF